MEQQRNDLEDADSASSVKRYGLRRMRSVTNESQDEQPAVPTISRGKLWYHQQLQDHKDKGTLEAFHSSNAERLRIYRATRMTDETRARERERTRKSMVAYRQRKKEMEKAEQMTRLGADYRQRKKEMEKAKQMTRQGAERELSEDAARREKMRLYQQARRASMSQEAKEMEKQKRKLRKMHSTSKCAPPSTSSTAPGSSVSTANTSPLASTFAAEPVSSAQTANASPLASTLTSAPEPASVVLSENTSPVASNSSHSSLSALGSLFKTPEASRKAARASSTDPNDLLGLHQLKAVFHSPRKTKAFVKLCLPKILEKRTTSYKSGKRVSFLHRLNRRIKSTKSKKAALRRRMQLVADVVAIMNEPISCLSKKLDLLWQFVKVSTEAEELQKTCPQNAILSELRNNIRDMFEQPEVATVINNYK